MNLPEDAVFDKPIVSQSDFDELARLFLDSPVNSRTRFLGGVPNVTIGVASDDQQLAIRVCNNGYTSPAHLDLELATLRYLWDSGFRLAPVPVPGVDGQLVPNWRGYRVFATRLIQGRTADEVDVTPEHCSQLGHAIGHLTALFREFNYPTSEGFSYWTRSARLLDVLATGPIHEAWDLDTKALHAQWQAARIDLCEITPQEGFIHTDIWPPNVLVVDGQVVGIVDFDDMAWGPPFLDLAAAVSEFAIGPELDLDGSKFAAMVSGYRAAGGVVGERELEAILPAITVCYASWLACNALHQVPFLESVTYAERLVALQSRVVRSRLVRELRGAVGMQV